LRKRGDVEKSPGTLPANRCTGTRVELDEPKIVSPLARVVQGKNGQANNADTHHDKIDHTARLSMGRKVGQAEFRLCQKR
jgi:hypothetical protein